MSGTADRSRLRRTVAMPRLGSLRAFRPGRLPRLGPAGSVRSEAGARAAVVAVSLLLSLGLAVVLQLVLAVAG
jgi:hypothetical protein